MGIMQGMSDFGDSACMSSGYEVNITITNKEDESTRSVHGTEHEQLYGSGHQSSKGTVSSAETIRTS